MVKLVHQLCGSPALYHSFSKNLTLQFCWEIIITCKIWQILKYVCHVFQFLQNAPTLSCACWWWLPSGLASQSFRKHTVSNFVKNNYVYVGEFIYFYSKISFWKFKMLNLLCLIFRETTCTVYMYMYLHRLADWIHSWMMGSFWHSTCRLHNSPWHSLSLTTSPTASFLWLGWRSCTWHMPNAWPSSNMRWSDGDMWPVTCTCSSYLIIIPCGIFHWLRLCVISLTHTL